MLAKLKSLWLLGTAFFFTLLRARLGIGRKRGLKLFDANYRQDGLVPMSLAQREVFRQAQRCNACGRCNQGDARLLEKHGGRYPGMMTLVLSGARGTPDFAAARDAWQLLSNVELEQRETLCPMDVPLRRLKETVISRCV